MPYSDGMSTHVPGKRQRIAQNLQRRADAREARIVALEVALRRYGRHEPGCPWHAGARCACGYSDALGEQ